MESPVAEKDRPIYVLHINSCFIPKFALRIGVARRVLPKISSYRPVSIAKFSQVHDILTSVDFLFQDDYEPIYELLSKEDASFNCFVSSTLFFICFIMFFQLKHGLHSSTSESV